MHEIGHLLSLDHAQSSEGLTLSLINVTALALVEATAPVIPDDCTVDATLTAAENSLKAEGVTLSAAEIASKTAQLEAER